MSALWAIATREYASLFRIPLGWIAVALFLLLSGYLFISQSIHPGEPVTMRPFFGAWWGLLIVLAPLTSMRLFSEEIRTGTIEPLLTSPASEVQTVLGKYLAGMLFFATMLVPTLSYVVLLEVLSRPDYGPIVAGYLGIVLLGMLYLAVGTLISTMTGSQMLAGLATFFVLLSIDVFLVRLAPTVPDRLGEVFYLLAPSLRIAEFGKGIIDTADVAFFLVGSAWFLALAVISLDSRRWR